MARGPRYIHAMTYLHPHAAPFRFEGSLTDEVVFLHGWTGSPAHLRPLARVIADAGYSVTAPLLAGHGTTERDMVGTTWREWLRSAAEAAQEVIDRGNRLHLAGLSMGGVLALLMNPTFRGASITTINAPIRVHSRRSHIAWLVRGSDRIRELPPDIPPDDEVAEYWQSYDDQPVGTAAELVDLIRAARKNLSRVTARALIIQSEADETVHRESGQIIYDGISSFQKRLLWLPTSRHVATLDSERHLIAEAMLEHLAAAAAVPRV